ncbi:MAG TPA: xanthine phosphoribosyltransferase [Alphaproteobacteria bacterium]|jgi:xanthine phosphoribosyltransferase|nr:xanthine phosphoribosyltransferase [Alphaproteobacteria bacterium]
MTLTNPNDHVVTWAEVHRDTRALVDRLGPDTRWTGIVAVARGGLVPAAIVARELDIRMIETLCVASYDDPRTRGAVRILNRPESAAASAGSGWLVVDDMVDSGATLRAARVLLPLARFATVYAKPEGIASVDVFVHRVAQESWITFPWDLP